jgi:hypothetical protein
MTQPAGPDAPPRPDVLRVPGGRAAMREPSVRFDVKPDGAITVTTREGDNELSVTYGSREAFKSAAPELFKRFEAAEKRIR